MKIQLGNRELVLQSASISRSMSDGIGEWNAVIEWEAGKDQELDNLVKKGSFAESVASIGGINLVTGNKYVSIPALSNSRSVMNLRGYSKVYRLIKSNPKEQREFLDQSLLDITGAIVLPFGLFTAVQAPEELANEKFEKETIDAQSTPFEFLQNLARQRSLLTSDDTDGNLFYQQAKINQATVGSIIEGVEGARVPVAAVGANVPTTENFTARFDDTEIFQNYQALNESPYAYLLKEPPVVVKDSSVKIPSFKTISVNSLIKGAGKKAIQFARNYARAQALQLPFSVNSWYAPNGRLWQENTLVSVTSPTLFVPGGFTFLIRAVQYALSGQGETAVLSLVPPSLLTGGEIEEPESWTN